MMPPKDILLNDILKITDLNNIKFRFLLDGSVGWDPLRLFRENKMDQLLQGHYWNYDKRKVYKVGDKTFGFVKIDQDRWLFFHAGQVTKDIDKMNGLGYKYIDLKKYDKYLGRIIIRYHNTSQNLIRHATSVIGKCTIEKILPDVFNEDIFPGYDKIRLSWTDLSRVIKKENWKTALGNQKGVYLITDRSNGKIYIGAAYGQDMLLNRWMDYVHSGHGGNKELKKLSFDHIKDNFIYTILDIYKSTTPSEIILEREGWWKTILLSRQFGYNSN